MQTVAAKTNNTSTQIMTDAGLVRTSKDVHTINNGDEILLTSYLQADGTPKWKENVNPNNGTVTYQINFADANNDFYQYMSADWLARLQADNRVGIDQGFLVIRAKVLKGLTETSADAKVYTKPLTPPSVENQPTNNQDSNEF
jgi:hypothetical protein